MRNVTNYVDVLLCISIKVISYFNLPITSIKCDIPVSNITVSELNNEGLILCRGIRPSCCVAISRGLQSVQRLGYRLDGRGVRIPVGARDFFPSPKIQTGSRGQLTSCLMGTAVLSSG